MQQQATPPSAMATPPVSMYSSETATYVNVVSPSARVPVAGGGGNGQHMAPPPYPQPPPTNNMMPRPPLYAAPGQHPGSGGHVPYSPVFSHHQHHIRPVGIANVMPRQGSSTASTMNNNQHENNNTQRQSSVGNDEKKSLWQVLRIFNVRWNLRCFLLLQNRRTPESFLRNSESLRYKAKTIPSFRQRQWWPPRPPTTHQVRKVSRRKKGCRINGLQIRWKNGQKNR